jgi:hypothetical protein
MPATRLVKIIIIEIDSGNLKRPYNNTKNRDGKNKKKGYGF